MVVYSLAQPIRSKILNYKKFVKELDLDRFKEDHETIKCNCQKYSVDFVNPERQHVLTGNLKIVKKLTKTDIIKDIFIILQEFFRRNWLF